MKLFKKKKTDETEIALPVNNVLDFNPKLINTVFIGKITDFLKGWYQQNEFIVKEHTTTELFYKTKRQIERFSAFATNSDITIKINKARLVEQRVETVTFVSEVVIRCEADIGYKRTNNDNGDSILYFKKAEMDFLLTHDDDGWKIADIRRQLYICEEYKVLKDDFLKNTEIDFG